MWPSTSRARGGGSASIWISPVGGGAPIRLTPEGATERAAAWSPDGQSIACIPRGTRRGWTRDHPRRDERSAANAGHAVSPESFPHGRRMANGSPIRRRPTPCGWSARMVRASVSSLHDDVSGHERRRGTTRSSGLATAEASTRPDERTIASCRWSRSTPRPAPSASSARWARTSISRTPSDPGLRFTLAPDGKSFLGTIVRTRTDLWILEDFAPRGGVLDWFRRRGSQ